MCYPPSKRKNDLVGGAMDAENYRADVTEDYSQALKPDEIRPEVS